MTATVTALCGYLLLIFCLEKAIVNATKKSDSFVTPEK